MHKRETEETVTPEEIKRELTRRVEELARHLFPHGKRIGNNWCVGSITGAPGKSFKVCVAGPKAGLSGDFAEFGRHSQSLLDLWIQARGVDFSTALHEAAQWLDDAPPLPATERTTKQLSGTPRSVDDFLSAEECSRALEMAVTLRETPNLCERIASARGWQAETLRGLTFEPSLGWHKGKLAFIYETGVKLRWRQNGERVICWAFGKPWLWRGSLIDTAGKIYLCEGETDAINLIDAGIEK